MSGGKFPIRRDPRYAEPPYAGGAMNMKVLVIPLTLISITSLTACALPSQAQTETPAQIWHELVVCARAHGMPNMPDPTIDSQGQARFPQGTPTPPPATRQACQSIYNRLPASVRNSAPPDITMEIKFAQCMRSHGLTDWPDPNANGDFPLPLDLRSSLKSGPLWTRIKAAWDACRAFNPSGGISVSQS
jgi:hypothetical protein